jgi:hypothetical protein
MAATNQDARNGQVGVIEDMLSKLKLGAGQSLSLGNLEHSMNMLATQGISGTLWVFEGSGGQAIASAIHTQIRES